MTEQDQYKQGDLVRYKGETYLVGKQPLGYEGYAAHLVGLTDDGNYIKFDALQLVAKAEDIATIATITAERDALQKECDWWRRNGCEQSDMDKVRDCVESAKGIIATLTAERDALVAAIGVALPLLDRVPGDEYTLDEHDDIRIMKEMHLAAQLKEQPND